MHLFLDIKQGNEQIIVDKTSVEIIDGRLARGKNKPVT
jgi:hypothetical protein